MFTYPFPFFSIDADKHIIDINDATKDFTGYTQEQLIGVDFGSLFTEPLKADAMLKEVFTTGSVANFPLSFHFINSHVTVLFNAIFYQDYDKKIKKVFAIIHNEEYKILPEGAGIHTDLTERKKTEEQRLLFELIINSSDDAIIGKDLNGMIMSWNKGAENIFGYTEEEIIGHHISIIIPPELLGEEKMIIKRIRQNRYVDHYETIRLRKDQEKINVSITVSPIKNITGCIVGASKIIRDITVRKRLEQKLQQLNTELEQKFEARTKMLRETLAALENSKEELSLALAAEKELNELKSRFVATASHEFRTPLSTILSSVFLLEEYNDTNEIIKRGKHLQYIKEASSNMKNILEEFLSLSKLEEGLTQSKQVVLSAEELFNEVRKVVNKMEQHCKYKQKILFTHENNHPSYIDIHLLKNILNNLISNAIKFSSSDAIIKINCITTPSQLIVSIEDNGIGISKEDLKHLFERFFRAKNATNIEGTGLGLHITSKYLELMNGHIEIKSELNQGTTFTFFIPFKTTNR